MHLLVLAAPLLSSLINASKPIEKWSCLVLGRPAEDATISKEQQWWDAVGELEESSIDTESLHYHWKKKKKKPTSGGRNFWKVKLSKSGSPQVLVTQTSQMESILIQPWFQFRPFPITAFPEWGWTWTRYRFTVGRQTALFPVCLLGFCEGSEKKLVTLMEWKTNVQLPQLNLS